MLNKCVTYTCTHSLPSNLPSRGRVSLYTGWSSYLGKSLWPNLGFPWRAGGAEKFRRSHQLRDISHNYEKTHNPGIPISAPSPPTRAVLSSWKAKPLATSWKRRGRCKTIKAQPTTSSWVWEVSWQVRARLAAAWRLRTYHDWDQGFLAPTWALVLAGPHPSTHPQSPACRHSLGWTRDHLAAV